MEQRRSQRYPQSLRVQLTVGRAKIDAETLDVSRHGLFVKTDAAVDERQLLQMSIELPSGALPATAVVSHKKAGATPGLGLQLFALSSASKARWDEFVYGLDAAGVAPAPSQTPPDTPTFLIKLKNVNRLLEFYDRNVRAGAVYLTTPVLREQGTKLALNIIHPDSEDEFVLTGTVASVCMDTPKGMEIHLDRMTDSALATFREYVTTGVRPDAKRVPTAEAVPAAAEEALSDDLSIDIVVDEDALEDSTQFVWRDVKEDDLVIDFDTSGMGEVRTGTTDLVPITEESISLDVTAPAPTPITASLGPERELLVAVRCSRCEAEYDSLRLGPAKGDLGVIASHQPYWWPSEQKIVSILRLNPPDERRELRAQLGEVELNRPISLRLAFKIADMSGPPRCPDGTAARVTPLIRALKDAMTTFGDDPRLELDTVRCNACQERGVVVERWD